MIGFEYGIWNTMGSKLVHMDQNDAKIKSKISINLKKRKRLKLVTPRELTFVIN